MKTQKVEYKEGKATLEGFLAYDEFSSDKRPLVLIFHAWRGRDDFVEKKAQQMAEMGYVGFAADVYGKGLLGDSVEENMRLMTPFMEDRNLLRKRLLAAWEVGINFKQVDSLKVAAIGFCFGGLCAIDLARSGKAQGVVSFHGLLGAPEGVEKKKISAKILALHGHDDPMVLPEQVLAFEEEMTKAKADWQVHVYGGAMHAFTNPMAQDPKMGTLYNAAAAGRSFKAMKGFFDEIFA